MAPEATAAPRWPPSRVQPFELPPGAVACVSEPVVQPIRPPLPALDLLRREHVAAPVLGARNAGAGEPFASLLEPVLERRAIFERSALLARPRAELRFARPRREVGAGPAARQRCHGAREAGRPVEPPPVQRAGRPGIRGELARLAARPVREECDARLGD